MQITEEKMQTILREKTPDGYVINEKAIKGIAKRLIATNGVCPCYHEEWTEKTPLEDKLCLCKTFRDTGKCHCKLYLEN